VFSQIANLPRIWHKLHLAAYPSTKLLSPRSSLARAYWYYKYKSPLLPLHSLKRRQLFSGMTQAQSQSSPALSSNRNSTPTSISNQTAGQKRKRPTDKKFYAVKSGKAPGVYETWNECLNQVRGQKGALCKSSLFRSCNAPRSAHLSNTTMKFV
jgi:hypothetical protein